MRNGKISVRELVEYSLRGGSIDYEYQSRQARAAEGVIFHKRLQKKRGAAAALEGFSYEREVAFSRSFESEGIEITVRGRADGILIKDEGVYIEEIKTTEAPLEMISDAPVHIAQAKCYAYFYTLENDIEQIYVLLTYYNTQTNETKEYSYEFSRVKLAEFFHEVLQTYAKWVKFLTECKEKRDKSIRALPFPYRDYRAGQRDMCVAVYRAIERKRKIFISAPTGIGKTISAIFPAVKALEREDIDKIFYLTAKSITRQTALNAAALMEQKGLIAKILVLTAKDKSCPQEKAVCSPESCERANGHFNRVNAALRDILENETIITRETMLAYSNKHSVCPHEYSLDIALFADIVICDYNYAFDPRVYLRRFFAETNERFVFLIDEAHNLVDRSREMYSASISGAGLKILARKLRKNDTELKMPIAELIEKLSSYSDLITDNDYGLAIEELPETFVSLIADCRYAADKWLLSNKKTKPGVYDEILELFFALTHFISISEMFDEKFFCCFERERSGIRIKLFCSDPSGCMEIMLKNAESTAFFSATLTPLDYFKRLLGGDISDYAITFPSPFPKENLLVLAINGISAKYRDREFFYEDISDCIFTAANAAPGNYIAFFPSYAYLESVSAIFREKYPETRILCQAKDMGEAEREHFLAQFLEQDTEPFISFAVLGGMFSEGIDLPGKRLCGAFIISVGLPTPSLERLLISNYFAKKEGRGFEYSYMFPGMNKVLQAGGRVIRTPADRGIIFLIDERFSLREYRALFPESWGNVDMVRGNDALREAVDSFMLDSCQ